MVAFTVDHGRTGLSGQVLEDIAQRFDQAVAQRIALGGTAQAHHGDSTLHVQNNAIGGCTFKDGVALLGHRWVSQMT